MSKKKRTRKIWAPAEIRLLKKHYPNKSGDELAAMFGRSVSAVYGMAGKLNIHKSAAYLASPQACRLRRGDNIGAPYRFKKGHKPHNAGKPGWSAGGKSIKTRFKKGQRPHTWAPIGSERLMDGYLQRKVTDTGYSPRDWVGVHILLWQEHTGQEIPPGHILSFKDGNKSNITIDNLELITRAERMRRNTIHRYPPELRDAIRAAGKLRRAIRSIETDEK